MNPFEDFNHFIAYFVPGVALFFVALASASLAEGNTSFVQDTNFLSILIGSTIAGLLLDEARHVWLEPRLEQKWARERRFDLGEIDEFPAYVPKMGIELYKLIRDEYFYYYEFDLNISIVMFPASAVVFMYLERFNIVTNGILRFGFSAALFIIAFGFWKFGRNAYDAFLDTFVTTMSKVDTDFLESIKKEES